MFCVRYELDSVYRLRRLVVELSTLEFRFDPRLVHVRFVVDRVALGQILHTVLRFSPVGVI